MRPQGGLPIVMDGANEYVRTTTVCLVLGSVLVTSACNSGDAAGRGTGATGAVKPPAPAATLDFSVDGADRPVEPDQKLTVSAKGGQLVSVRLVGPDGEVVPGRVSEGVWQSSPDAVLTPDSPYTWRASARNPDGRLAQKSVSIRTIKPRVTATYSVLPDGQTVGVGMPVTVLFDSGVAADLRADVEKRMSLKVVPAQRGSWGWLDERQLMWRPDSYWKPGTKITVKAPLTGVRTGDGKYIGKDKGANFTIADRARVSKVDIAGHVMRVTEDGKTVATYPISAGRPTAAWETRSGTKIITEKHANYVMDAATLGVDKEDPNYYRTEAKYALRVTNTGEFLHSAPWSMWAQGSRNVSHGCVNLSPANAAQMFRQSIVGDVVEFTGSDRRMLPGDGVSVWLFSAKEWRARSALAPKPRTAPSSNPTSKQTPGPGSDATDDAGRTATPTSTASDESTRGSVSPPQSSPTAG